MGIDLNRAKLIFLEATEQPDPAARAAYLDSVCSDDAELRKRVEALLRSHDTAGSFLGTPAVAPVDSEGANTLACADSDSAGADPGNAPDDLSFLSRSDRPEALGRLGHYDILQVLGKGAFGIVFRAFDQVLQRVVAVKVMAPHLATLSPARKRFLREACSSAAVRHDNVVQIHEVNDLPLPYLVMEFIPGETLQQRIDRTGPLEVPEVLRIGRQIAEGLAAAHASDLIHRDIKPGNVLLENRSHRVKITDFGLARAADDASISQSGVIAGTPMYMAPEQALGQRIDQRADLFSLGSVLYQIVSGRPPFRAPTALAVLKRVAEETPRPIQEIIPETPDWLCAIISKLHAKDPADRFQSAREVADLLIDCEARLKAKQEIKFVFPPAVKPAPPTGTSRRLWTTAAAVPLFALLALAMTEFSGTTHWFRARPATTEPLPPVATTAQVEQERFEAWVKRVSTMPAEQQVEEVRKELLARNPAFQGKVEPALADGQVHDLSIEGTGMRDVAPVRALRRLRNLNFVGGSPDVAPLRELGLTSLALYNTDVSDLSALEGMKLTAIDLSGSGKLTDLSPLAGMSLETLTIFGTRISNLTPLKGMRLTHFNCDGSAVTDLTPLRGMPLGILNAGHNKITDLTPLRDMPLEFLYLEGSTVTDLSPLKGLPLKVLRCDFDAARDARVLRAIRTLEMLNDRPAAELLKE